MLFVAIEGPTSIASRCVVVLGEAESTESTAIKVWRFASWELRSDSPKTNHEAYGSHPELSIANRSRRTLDMYSARVSGDKKQFASSLSC